MDSVIDGGKSSTCFFARVNVCKRSVERAFITLRTANTVDYFAKSLQHTVAAGWTPHPTPMNELLGM